MDAFVRLEYLPRREADIAIQGLSQALALIGGPAGAERTGNRVVERTLKMAGDNLVLYVASYADADSANADFETLKSAEGSDLSVEAAVVMSRDGNGDVDVLTKGSGMTGGGAVLGGGVGLVVGLFAPPLLMATAIGAGIGAVLGHLTKKHEEKELGVDLDDYFPANSSAVVVVVDNKYLDRVEAALGKATKKVNKAIDSGDYDKLQKALAKSDDEIGDAIDS